MAAGPRLDEAELVTMVGCSGPSFTNEACVTLGKNHVPPEMRLRTLSSPWTRSELEVAVARHPRGFEGVPDSCVQTFSGECRSLCRMWVPTRGTHP